MAEMAITVVNLKGGVGKTTISIILAELALLRKNKKVLAIDLDSQENFSTGLSFVSRYFGEKLRIKKELDFENDENAPEDWIIIDCPPRLDDENVKQAMEFADIVLVPIRPDIFSVLNLDKVFNAANLDKRKSHNQIPIIKVGFDDSRISNYTEDILYDYDYPVIGDMPLFKNIPYNIAKGRVWSVGLTAYQRFTYENIIDRISNAFKLMTEGHFDEAWGDDSIQENNDNINNEGDENNNNTVNEPETPKKQLDENRFLGNFQKQ